MLRKRAPFVYASCHNPRELSDVGVAFLSLRGSGVPGPLAHKQVPLLKQVTAPIRILNLVTNRMRKRCFGDLSRKVDAFRGPVSDRRAKAMRGNVCATMRRSKVSIAILDNGALPFAFGNTNPSSCFKGRTCSRTASTAADNGTLCSLGRFILTAGSSKRLCSRLSHPISHRGLRRYGPQLELGTRKHARRSQSGRAIP